MLVVGIPHKDSRQGWSRGAVGGFRRAHSPNRDTDRRTNGTDALVWGLPSGIGCEAVVVGVDSADNSSQSSVAVFDCALAPSGLRGRGVRARRAEA